jgi:hypothetical protein
MQPDYTVVAQSSVQGFHREKSTPCFQPWRPMQAWRLGKAAAMHLGTATEYCWLVLAEADQRFREAKVRSMPQGSPAKPIRPSAGPIARSGRPDGACVSRGAQRWIPSDQVPLHRGKLVGHPVWMGLQGSETGEGARHAPVGMVLNEDGLGGKRRRNAPVGKSVSWDEGVSAGPDDDRWSDIPVPANRASIGKPLPRRTLRELLAERQRERSRRQIGIARRRKEQHIARSQRRLQMRVGQLPAKAFRADIDPVVPPHEHRGNIGAVRLPRPVREPVLPAGCIGKIDFFVGHDVSHVFTEPLH